MDRVVLAPETTAAFHRDVDGHVEALVAAVSIIPGNGHVERCADGGLWVAVGNDALWTIVGMAPGCWWPSVRESGVVARSNDAEPPVAIGGARRPR